jgi:photosystem II stability/assembly factor-like uncharacterized protein
MLIVVWCGCADKRIQPVVPVRQSAATTLQKTWREQTVPFRAVNITALGNVFWICGADEMIASSIDGGNTWELRHEKRDGAVLLNIAFVNDKIGHAAGRGGLVLSTSNSGRTWKEHHAPDVVRTFSFADGKNGIAFVGGRLQKPPFGGVTFEDGTVVLTHDGGDHWNQVTALSSYEFSPFTGLLSIAALDRSHYLMIRRQPEIEDAFAVTQDSGKTWKLVHVRNDDTNREFPTMVFVREGEFWALGMELVNRQTGGGYGVPLTMHSKDGGSWTHGIRGTSEFGMCNSQACVMWDGAVEQLYGEHEKFWNVPQDAPMSGKWAMAGDHVCMIGLAVKCATALATDRPQPRPVLHGIQSSKDPTMTANAPFADDCVGCGVEIIKFDPGIRWHGQVLAHFTVAGDGTVADDLTLEGAPDDRLRDEIGHQVQRWLFEGPPKGQASKIQQRSIPIDVRCLDAPQAPGIDGCRMFPAKGPS